MSADNFNRADDTDLSAGGAPIAWTNNDSPDVNALRVNANELQMITALSGGSIFGGFSTDPTLVSADHSATLEFVSIVDVARGGVGVRMSGANPSVFTGYIAIFDGVDIRLYKYVAQDMRTGAVPAGTVLGTAATTLAAGDTMGLQVVGSELAVRKNSGVIILTNDADIASGGGGVCVISNSNAATRAMRWDNYVGAENPTPVSSRSGGVVNTGLSVSRKLILSLSGLGRHRRM